MNTDAVTVKIEPPDDFEAATGARVSSAPLQNGTAENINSSCTGENCGQSALYSDPRNFTCLLCDIVCSNREELIKHLKNTHSSKTYSDMSNAVYTNSVASNSSSQVFSGYINHRYRCQTCGAKFKNFRTYLTHSMSHGGSGVLRQFDDMRMASLFDTGKQYMQDYIETEDGYAGTFICSECKTVFTQRDAYAMHMMMRAMNETCKPSNTAVETSSPVVNVVKETVDVVKQVTNPKTVAEHGEQKCLEDVTSKVDQDEYLKSVLDKVCVSEIPNTNFTNYHMSDRKICAFCKETFVDQDSLAMHVMSVHANEVTSSAGHNMENLHMPRAQSSNYLAWMTVANRPLVMSCVCKYCNESFMSQDSLALHVLTHAHQDKTPTNDAHRIYKRTAEQLSPVDSTNQPKKIPKTDNENERSEVANEKENLYCLSCNIHFYAVAEYQWHMRRHIEESAALPDEPLCLAMKSKHENNVVVQENINAVAVDGVRKRRNSFPSFGSTNRQTDLSPKRPVSAGGDFPKNESGNIGKHWKTSGNIKTMTKSEIMKTIHALSASEQRIIYSVFGRDLNLKLADELNEDCKQNSTQALQNRQSSEQIKSESAQPSAESEIDNQQLPSATSGIYKNAEQNGRSKLLPAQRETPMCKYCEILFFNKAIYYLHMGLHNVNNPWQCNVCGKICNDAVDFAAHVIHM